MFFLLSGCPWAFWILTELRFTCPRDSRAKANRARNDYDEETAYESYMNPEPGFQSGPGVSVDAN